MKNLNRLSILMMLAANLVMPLQAAEQSSLAKGANASTIMNASINKALVDASMAKQKTRMDNVLACQQNGQLWNGSSCVAVAGIGGGVPDGTVALTVQMASPIVVYGSVPGGIYTADSGSHHCGLFGINNCVDKTCMQQMNCDTTSTRPTVVQSGSYLIITPRSCQTVYRDLGPC
jgi:hypothetical protein